MRVPELVYQFVRPLDSAGPTFELYQRRQGPTLFNGIQLFQTFSGIPKDRVLVISNIQITAVPGGAVDVQAIHLRGATQAGRILIIEQLFFPVPASAGDSSRALNWTGEIALLGAGAGNETLSGIVDFSAANAGNSIDMSVFGTMIPRGNIAQA